MFFTSCYQQTGALPPPAYFFSITRRPALSFRGRFYRFFLALFGALFLSAFTLTAQAADAPTLAATITTYGLTATVDSGDVNVSGTLSNNAQLVLDIDAGITVNWSADLSGNTGDGLTELVQLRGAGVFNMTGGSIVNAATGGAALAAMSDSPAFTGDITISGGKIEGAGGLEVNSATAVTITGGEFVSATDNAAIRISGTFSGSFTIGDAAKIAPTGNTAIQNNSTQDITITHGNVEIVKGDIRSNMPGSRSVIINPGATLKISGATTVSALDGGNFGIINNGTLENNGTLTFGTGGTYSGTGTITGTGTVSGLPSQTINYPGDFPPLTLRTVMGTANSLFPDAPSGNSVTVNSGSIGGSVFGGVSAGADNVTNNEVTINSGVIGNAVFGGRSTSGSVTGNNVTVNGGTMLGVSGGRSTSGSATGNNVTVNGGTINVSIEGGSTSNGDAINNTVTITGSPILSSIFGGIAPSGNTFTGNTLNWNTSELTVVVGVFYFEFINFNMPSSVANGTTLLTLTTATDLTGVTIDVDFLTTAPTLAEGDVITLISSVSGTFTPKNVTVDGYTFALSVSGGALIATVVRTPGSGAFTWNGSAAGQAADIADGGTALPTLITGDIVTIANGASGTLTVPDGVTITIDSSTTGGPAQQITIDIGTGAVVNWQANYSTASTNASGQVVITGAGTLNITGTIQASDGTRVITHSGSGTINVNSGGSVNIAGGANSIDPIVIYSSGTVNVNDGGTVTGGASSAIWVMSIGATANCEINVNNGGTVRNNSSSSPAIAAYYGTVNINGGTVENMGSSHAIDLHTTVNVPLNISGGTIKGGSNGYGVNAGSGVSTININSSDFSIPIIVSGGLGAFSKAPTTLPAVYTAEWSNSADGTGSSSGSVYTWDAAHRWVKFIIPDLTITGWVLGTDYTYSGGVLTITANGTYTIGMASGVTETTDRIVVASGLTGANITLDGVNIDLTGTGNYAAFDMTGATVNLTLTGNNTLKSGSQRAGLTAPDGSTLTIGGTGSLTATGGAGGTNGAGIGGYIEGTNISNAVGGNITINSGTVNATAGAGAGIGGVRGGGTVIITGGNVTATGAGGGAGIGGGNQGNGGTITISGGTVIATGAGDGAGIGGGSSGLSGNITISGGNVTAAGAVGGTGAGIGGGNIVGGTDGNRNILIYGETTVVTATKGTGSGTQQDIGAGNNSDAYPHSVFVALTAGNLKNASGNIGNAVTFSAVPTSAGTVTATLSAPFNALPFTVGGVYNILTGLSTPKQMSVITTLGSVSFALSGYGNSPLTKTATELTATGATVEFGNPTAPTITSTDNTTVTFGEGGTFTVTAIGFPSAMTYSLGGTVPAGVSINSTSGLITIEATTNAGDYPITITASNGVGTAATQNFTLTVNKATGSNFPAHSAIGATYTPTLTLADLNGQLTSGYAWLDGTTQLTVANSGTGFAATYTDPNGNYTAVIGTITVNVAKAAAPTITFPTSTAITYGAALSTSTLTGGSTEYGTFAWTNGLTIPTVTNSGYSVTFTPNANTIANYEPITTATANVAITVAKATYTGLTTATADIRAGEVTMDKVVQLPALPDGASYAASGTLGGITPALISSHSISGTTLTISTTAQTDGTSATITIGVVGATNYNDYSVVVTITARDVLQEDTPVAAIDFAGERFVNLVAGAEYRISGETRTADGSGNIAISENWMGGNVGIVKTGITANNTEDSDPQTLAIPARPAAPTGVGKTDTSGGQNNGEITGVGATMEYRLNTASAWMAVGGTTVTGLAAGAYQVRYIATQIAFSSEYASVTIAASFLSGVASIPTLNPMALVLLVLMLAGLAVRRRRV